MNKRTPLGVLAGFSDVFGQAFGHLVKLFGASLAEVEEQPARLGSEDRAIGREGALGQEETWLKPLFWNCVFDTLWPKNMDHLKNNYEYSMFFLFKKW